MNSSWNAYHLIELKIFYRMVSITIGLRDTKVSMVNSKVGQIFEFKILGLNYFKMLYLLNLLKVNKCLKTLFNL